MDKSLLKIALKKKITYWDKVYTTLKVGEN